MNITETNYSLKGQVVLKEEKRGVFGLEIVLYDKDHKFDDRLGRTFTDHDGKFYFHHFQKALKDINEKVPEIILQVRDAEGQVIYDDKISFLEGGNPDQKVVLEIPNASLSQHLSLAQPLHQLVGGILDANKLGTISRAMRMISKNGDKSKVSFSGRSLKKYQSILPGITTFSNVLDMAWDLIDTCRYQIQDCESAHSNFTDFLQTLIYRKNATMSHRMNEFREGWENDSHPSPLAIDKIAAKRRSHAGVLPVETLIEKDRIYPIIWASIIAGKADSVVINEYLSVILGEIRGVFELDIVYRAAKNALASPQKRLTFLRDIVKYFESNNGIDDGPMKYPLRLPEIDAIEELGLIEMISAIEHFRVAEAEERGDYHIDRIEWGVGCPGTIIQIYGRNLLGVLPSHNRVLFTSADSYSRVFGSTPSLPFIPDHWTDEYIAIAIPDTAGPGPIDLQIVDRVRFDLGGREIMRIGNASDFSFEGGGAHIRKFQVRGLPGYYDTFRVPPGTNIKIDWEVVPENAEVNVLEQKFLRTPDDDSGFERYEPGSPTPAPNVGRNIVCMLVADRLECTLFAENACRDSKVERKLTFLVDRDIEEIEGIA